MAVYYTEDHEWVLVDGDKATIGITEHAAEALGEIVFVEVKDAGEAVEKGGDLGVIESVKAASEFYAPISCEVVEFNTELEDNPAHVNESPEGDAWICKVTITDQGELSDLMDVDAYKKLIA